MNIKDLYENTTRSQKILIQNNVYRDDKKNIYRIVL